MNNIWEVVTKLRQEAERLESLMSDIFCEKDIDIIEGDINCYLEEMEEHIELIKRCLYEKKFD